MATFEAQVEGLTSLSIDGSSAPTQDELTQFLTDGAKEIINILPPNLIDLCSASQSFTSGTADTLNTGKVLRVFRSDGDIKQPCRPIPASYKGRYSDPDDMNYATVTDPVFYIENNSLDVLPNGGTCTYSEVQYPAVVYGASDISVFPDEAEHLVVLYAAIKTLQNKMGSKSSSLPDDLIEPVLSEVSESLSSFTIPGSFILPTVPSDTDVNFSSVPLAPTYTNPTVFLNSAPVISNLVISAIAPFTPSLSTVEFLSVDSNFDTTSPTFTTAIAESSSIYTGSAPSYTKPVVALGTAPTISDLSISAVPPEPPTISASSLSFSATPPPYTSPTQTISGINWVTEYPAQASAITTALGKIVTEMDETQAVCDSVNADLVLAKAEVVLAKAEALELAAQTDNSGDYKTALDAVNTALDRIASYNWGDSDTFTSGSAQLTRVKHALDRTQDLIDGNSPSATTDAYGAQSNEDVELVSSVLNIAQAEIQRAQSHLAEWNTLLQGASVEAQGFASEAQARGGFSGAKAKAIQGYISTAQTYISSAQGFGNEVQVKIAISQGYSGEIQSRLSATPIKTQEYQAKVQDALNEFNEHNSEYQAELQRSIENARHEDSEETKKIQKYSAELQQYQAEVGAEVQEYQQNLDGDLRVWQQERETDLQKYVADIQNELNEFNKDNVAYQSAVQESFQNVQIANQVNLAKAQSDFQVATTNKDRDLQRQLQNGINDMEAVVNNNRILIQNYQAEVQGYQNDINKEIQEYAQNLDGDLRVWQAERTTDLQKYSSDIQKETSRFASDLNVYQQEIQKALQVYQAETGYDISKYDSEVRAQTSKFVSDLQKETEIFRTSMERYVNELQMITENNRSKLSKYATDIQNYNSKMQKHGVDYQWIQGQYAQLKAEYDQGLQLLIGGGIPQ